MSALAPLKDLLIWCVADESKGESPAEEAPTCRPEPTGRVIFLVRGVVRERLGSILNYERIPSDRQFARFRVGLLQKSMSEWYPSFCGAIFNTKCSFMEERKSDFHVKRDVTKLVFSPL
jgi:hypothetical protein